jgi:hypothetical protein
MRRRVVNVLEGGGMMTVLDFSGVDGLALFFKETHRHLHLLFLTFYYDYIADLACGECINYRLALVRYGELFPFVRVGGDFHKELINCFRVGLVIHKHHASSNSVGLFLEPFLGIIEWADGNGANLSALCQFYRHTQTLDRHNFHSAKSTFEIWTNMQQLSLFN